MPKVRQEEEAFEVPLTPLIDVVFLLLIFFLVATNFTRKEIDQQLKLPKSAGGVKGDKIPQNMVINIRKDGTLVVDGKIVEADKLKNMVAEFHAKNPDKRVSIRGDAQVPYQKVMRIMGLCKTIGVVNVDLPVEEPAGGSGG